MRRITALPNLITLANAFCGLLSIAKVMDALALPDRSSPAFYEHIEIACGLIFLGMLFDALDGKVARITGGTSEFGAQLDSFSDLLTFGCAPALLAKALIETEGPARFKEHPRLLFIAAVFFALMAILRLARFNLETTTDESSHNEFKGLPSPAAAGAVVSALLFHLLVTRPADFEGDDRIIGLLPAGFCAAVAPWVLPATAFLLPMLGLLMVSRLRYPHVVSVLTRKRNFLLLPCLVFGGLLLFLAKVLVVFLVFQGFVLFGLVWSLVGRKPGAPEAEAALDDEAFELRSRH